MQIYKTEIIRGIWEGGAPQKVNVFRWRLEQSIF